MAGPRPLGSRRSATACLPDSEIALASADTHGPARRGAGSVELTVPAAPLAPAPVGPADQKDYRLSVVQPAAGRPAKARGRVDHTDDDKKYNYDYFRALPSALHTDPVY
jgi:hypothetical protein